ncbi:MAG: AraC family transcriptional regulator [Opitutales bacterium]
MASGTPRLLFAFQNRSRPGTRAGLHHHAFWQLEWLLAGRAQFDEPELALHLRAGRGVLIPPRRPHRFLYPGPGDARYFSLRFVWEPPDRDRPLLQRTSRLAGVDPALFTTLQHQVPLTDHLSDREIQLVEALLKAVLASLGLARERFRGRHTGVRSRDGVIEGIEAMIHQAAGRPVRIQELAEHFGVQPATLAARYKAARGRSLKQTIDAHRARTAARLLTFTGLGLSAVADQLGFPDIYAFSRFFRRHQGEPPSAFRARQQAAG